jgi:hypothetical protein
VTPISEEFFTHFHYGEVFVGQQIELDGGWFEDCRFERCHVVFKGDRVFGLSRCTHDDATLLVVDGAARIILQLLVKSFTATTIDGLLNDLRFS